MARRRSTPRSRPVPASVPDAPAAARGTAWRALLIVVAGALAYATSISGPFIFDDESSIVNNTAIRDLQPATALMPAREAPTAGRPIVNLSFAINYAIGGLHVAGYHVANIAIHLLCALVLFAVLRRTLERPIVPPSVRQRALDLAFAAALIWVLHPINSEAVDYMTQRTESLMALFYLLTLYCAIRAAGSSAAETRPGVWTALSIVCCTLGMASKESMVTVPVMVVLYDRIFLFDSFARAWRERRVLYVGLAATWILLAAIVQTGPRMHSAGFNAGVDAWTYLVNQAMMIVRYLRLAAWPRPLVLAYGPPLPLSLGDVAPQALLVVALLVVTVVALVRRPLLGFLGAWFFITLAPSSSFVPIATEVGAERRMYLPIVAIIVLVVVIAGSRLKRPVGAALLAVVCLAMAFQTTLRAREYESSLVMARTVLDRWPTGFAHALYGVELSIAGRHEEALPHLREGARTYSKAHFNLGAELFTTGQVDEAIAELQRFLSEHPELLEAVRARTLLGRGFLQQKKYAEAIEQFRLVLSMTAPHTISHATALGLLADALFGQEKFPEAIAQYRAFLALRPTEAGAQMNLAIALANMGQTGEATTAFRRAVELNPSDVNARRNLASHLFNLGQLDAAAAEARTLLQQHPDNAAAHDLLGRVLGSVGRLAEARVELERAVQLDPRDEQARADLELLRRTMRER